MKRFDPSDTFVMGRQWNFATDLADAGGQKLDLTGATVTMGIGTGPTPMIRYATVAATVASDQQAETGVARATFSDTVTARFQFPADGLLWFQIDVAFGSGTTEAYVSGHLKVQRSLI